METLTSLQILAGTMTLLFSKVMLPFEPLPPNPELPATIYKSLLSSAGEYCRS